MNVTSREIKAIETVYNGYRFRSRLEARWAVFFDTLGVKYEYEAQGYETSAGWYLPDFLIPEWNCFVEVKGVEPSESEWDKMYALQGTGRLVLLLQGEPWLRRHRTQFAEIPIFDPNPSYEEFMICRCGGISILRDTYWISVEKIGRHTCEEPDSYSLAYRADDYGGGLLMQAYTNARQARFEHGETPK